MTQSPFRTAVVGFGRIGHSYSYDQKMAAKMRYATHAQVLIDHPDFSWQAVVDPNPAATSQALNHWHVPSVAEAVEQLPNREEIEVLVIATPPEHRLGIIELFPCLRAVLVEKPLGMSVDSAERFMEECHRRKVLVQVNLLRRADTFTRYLANGGLASMLGKVQTAFGIYGNGLANNGTHMVDLVRMLIGEIEAVQAGCGMTFIEGPLLDDVNMPFILHAAGGLSVMMQPVRFECYRENGLDIWGERGRFSYLHGGITLLQYGAAPSRLVETEQEVLSDQPQVHESTLGSAFYEMYTNLALTLRGSAQLLSSGQSMMKTEYVVAGILESARQSGRTVPVKVPSRGVASMTKDLFLSTN